MKATETARHFIITPEVAGGLGPQTQMDTSVHPPVVSRLHYAFDGWLGDDLLEGFPCFIATRRLTESLLSAGLTGFSVADVEVTRSELFTDIYGDRQLPEFRWLQISGLAGDHDFGQSSSGLVVSDRCLRLIQTFTARHLDVSPFTSA